MLAVTVTVDDVNDRPVVSGDGSPPLPEIEFDVDGAAPHDRGPDVPTVPGAYTFTDEDAGDVTRLPGP